MLMRDRSAIFGGAALLAAIVLVAAAFLPAHPRVVHTELTSLADQPGLPIPLEPDASNAAISLQDRTQKLIYIVPEHSQKMGDYMDFFTSCKKACGPSATLGREKCSSDRLGPVYLAYRDKCKADWHGCACQITQMYCG